MNWTGYTVHLTETGAADQPNLITNVETTDATVPDTELLDPIHAHLAARDLLPAAPLGDAGYVDAGILVPAASAHQVEVIGPVRADTNWQARQGQGFAASCFLIDWEAKCVHCPQGQRSVTWKERVDHLGHDVMDSAFGWADCKACPVRSACTRDVARLTHDEIAAPSAVPGPVRGTPTPTDPRISGAIHKASGH